MKFSYYAALLLAASSPAYSWRVWGWNDRGCTPGQASYAHEQYSNRGCTNFGFAAKSVAVNYIDSNHKISFHTGAGCSGLAWIDTVNGNGDNHCINVANGVFDGPGAFRSYQVTGP